MKRMLTDLSEEDQRNPPVKPSS